MQLRSSSKYFAGALYSSIAIHMHKHTMHHRTRVIQSMLSSFPAKMLKILTKQRSSLINRNTINSIQKMLQKIRINVIFIDYIYRLFNLDAWGVCTFSLMQLIWLFSKRSRLEYHFPKNSYLFLQRICIYVPCLLATTHL